MSRNSNQLSVAELLARNGQQPSAGGGGRRRRGGRGVSVTDLSGDLPVVEGGSAHAAPDDAEEPAGTAADYASEPADTGYGPQNYAAQEYSAEPSHSPMSGPITVYNPLAPYPDGAPAAPADPDPYAAPAYPAEDSSPRRGRRRRADPDDDADDGYPAAEPASQPWETGPPLPSGGRAARRRAAEAAEAAAAAETAEPAEEAPARYGPLPQSGGFGAFPAPPAESAGPEFGRPDMGPQWPVPEGGPPRLGPPAPATEVWQAPSPTGDPRPKLERRRRGSRPLPDPAPWPDPAGEPGPADQATAVWSLAEQSRGFVPGPSDLETPPLEKGDHGRRRGVPNGHPGPLPDRGFADPEPPLEHVPDDGFRNTDMYATDVHGPMPPVPGPLPQEHGPETGDFEPDSDIYAVPEDEAEARPRLRGARSALTGRLGAATGKLGAVRSRRAGDSRERDSEEPVDPHKQWIMLGAQSVGAALAGMLAFKGFEQLWALQPLAALALAVVVILGLVALVRILRRTDDILSTVIAVVVGVFVTLGPLAFLLSTG